MKFGRLRMKVRFCPALDYYINVIECEHCEDKCDYPIEEYSDNSKMFKKRAKEAFRKWKTKDKGLELLF